MSRLAAQWRRQIAAWRAAHPTLVSYMGCIPLGAAVILGICLIGIVLDFTTTVALPRIGEIVAHLLSLAQSLAPGLVLIALCVIILQQVAQQSERARRREKAAQRVEAQKRSHPELAAVIEVLDTNREISDTESAQSAFLSNLLFLIAGIAIPLALPLILAWLRAH